MMSDLLLVIGDKNLSSWSLRPWILMRHAGVPFREKVLLFETPGWRDAIVALSPSARVPVLHDGDLRVWDSLAIAEHVAELHHEKELWPRDRSVRAVARAVSAEMHSGFAAIRRELSMDVTARGVRRTLSREAEDDVRRVTAIFAEQRARHAADGPFLFGRFSIADAMFAPIMFRFRTYDLAPTDAAVRAYYETMLALPAMKEWERAAEAEVRANASAPRASAPPDPRSARAYYAVIFTSRRTESDAAEYEATAERMIDLAKEQPGFLGVDSARRPDGAGVTVSYWDSPEAIRAWKDVAEHRAAQAAGRDRFYERYEVRVCAVERGYKFPR
jgi:glutathione S-transferase